MRGKYVRPTEQISLQVTPSKLIGSHGADTMTFDYEVKHIAGADVTIDVTFSEEGKTGALELLVHLRDDGGLDISSAIPHAGGFIPGTWTAAAREGTSGDSVPTPN